MEESTKLILEHFLMRKAKEWADMCKEHKELTHASYHITPDSSYAAIEHEALDYNDMLVRKAPSCINVLAKL